MKNDWMLDVLADLKRFAQLNDMPTLAEKLTETADAAALEITSAEEKAQTLHGDDTKLRIDSSGAGGLPRA